MFKQQKGFHLRKLKKLTMRFVMTKFTQQQMQVIQSFQLAQIASERSPTTPK
jgi:hypothetical protein